MTSNVTVTMLILGWSGVGGQKGAAQEPDHTVQTGKDWGVWVDSGPSVPGPPKECVGR